MSGLFEENGGGEERWRRGKRPNILNIVTWRNYLATFYRQQLATLLAANAFSYMFSSENAPGGSNFGCFCADQNRCLPLLFECV